MGTALAQYFGLLSLMDKVNLIVYYGALTIALVVGLVIIVKYWDR